MITTEHMHIDPAYRERLRAAGLENVGQVLRRVAGRVAAWSRTTDTLYVPGSGDTPGFYVKRHFYPNWSKRLRGTLRGTFFGPHRGQAEYGVLTRMRGLGIPAVRPVACGSRRTSHFLAACFLITEEVPDAQNLTTFALDVAAGRRAVSPTYRRMMLRVLAHQLAAMHATGFVHGNLFWRNLLVRNGPDGRPEFFLLDARPLHAWQRFNHGDQRWIRELAQTTVSALAFTSPQERLRFLRQYLGVRLTPSLKPQLQRIDALARTWQRHEERRIHMNGLFDRWNRQLSEEEQPGTPLGLGAVAAEPAP